MEIPVKSPGDQTSNNSTSLSISHSLRFLLFWGRPDFSRNKIHTSTTNKMLKIIASSAMLLVATASPAVEVNMIGDFAVPAQLFKTYVFFSFFQLVLFMFFFFVVFFSVFLLTSLCPFSLSLSAHFLFCSLTPQRGNMPHRGSFPASWMPVR